MPFPSAFPRLAALLAAAAVLPSCSSRPVSGSPDGPVPPADLLCAGPGESYGIQDFPCPAATVEGWVDGRDGPRTREHAWYLFAGLHRTQPDGRPLWRTWPTSTEAFPDQFATGSHLLTARALVNARLEQPVPSTPRYVGAHAQQATPGVTDATLSLAGAPAYPLPDELARAYPACVAGKPGNRYLVDGPTIQNNGDLLAAGVIYSPDAAEWILNRRFGDAARLDALLPEAASAAPVPLEMNPNAVVLKPMLWPVRHDGFTALPLWDHLPPDADRPAGSPCEVYSGFERTDLWTRAVALTADPAREASTSRATASLLDGGRVLRAQTPYRPGADCKPQDTTRAAIVYEDVPVVPLSRFYQTRYTQAELDAMAPCDRALLDQAALFSFDRRFDARDALVMVAMHVMTKEQPGWTFQSAWWFDGAQGAACDTGDAHSRAACRRYASHRPGGVDGPDTWTNYLITTTYGMTQQEDAHGADAGEWPIAYNPYIELTATHPIETNCRNCHVRAAWPGPIHIDQERRFPERQGAYLAEGPDAPTLLDSLGFDDPVLNGLVTTDALWSIADRATYPRAD